MNEKQHYRSKHFPLGTARQEFTSIPWFLTEINNVHASHIVVDPLTYEYLGSHFIEFQEFAVMGTKALNAQGYLCRIWNTLVFTDAFLTAERQWVNADRMNKGGRSQYIVVKPEQLRPFAVEMRDDLHHN